MGFVVGLLLGLVIGAVVATIAFPATTAWFARREYRRASPRADLGTFDRIEAGTVDSGVRPPEHAG